MTGVVATEAQQIKLRQAARAIGRAGLAHAYGHCSIRLSDSHFLVCAPRPMGLIGTGEAGTLVPIHGELPEHVLGEVRIHQEAYKHRPDVGAVIRSMPASVMVLSAAGKTPQARHGMGCYFHKGISLWDDVQLVRTAGLASQLGSAFKTQDVVVMCGNGAVVTGASIEEALTLTWYLEDAARIELSLRAAGLDQEIPPISCEEQQKRATGSGGIFERMWEFLTRGDPE